jgi:fatty acid desaturase
VEGISPCGEKFRNDDLEHHLYPAVPHYHLPHLNRLPAGQGALQNAEVCDIGETWRLIFAPRSPHA